jgi:hypothetical protein
MAEPSIEHASFEIERRYDAPRDRVTEYGAFFDGLIDPALREHRLFLERERHRPEGGILPR